MRWRAAGRVAVKGALVAACLLFLGGAARGQADGAGNSARSSVAQDAGRERVLLVLPFDNRTGQPSLDWMREAAAEILTMRFASAGFEPTSRADRMYALDHLGLPQGFQPSRASSIKLAQTLDADSIVVGSYTVDGTNLTATASLVDVPNLRMLPAVTAQGEMRDMMGIFSALAWKLTRQLDPTFGVAEATFVAASRQIRVDAFEQYIRGVTEPDQAERLRHLQQAVKLSPGFGSAWMALGREDYNQQQYEEAAAAFARVDRNGADGLEAGFYRGLSLLFSGDYAQAQQAFTDVARVLPLAEVVNNEGVAVSRQGQDGTSLFIQAAAADPNDADYHFNLAVSLKRHGNTQGAIAEMAQCLKLRPADSEAQALLAAWKTKTGVRAASQSASQGAKPGSGATAAVADAEAGADPLERIVRTFDATAFKQAAAMMDEMNARRLAALDPPQRAQALCAQAKGFLDRGLLLEAERLYHEAVRADGRSAEARAGLAEVRATSGDSAQARKEAEASLKLGPTANAYLVLAQLDLAAENLTAASAEAGDALKLDPANRTAQEVLRQIQAKMGQK
ncbi:MAG: tetratricopeptide repeat protein [Terracidiphilus sp.]